MPTKQEIINMMENHLPGEPVNITNNREPPVYPVLQPPSLTQDYSQAQPPQPPPRESGVFTVVQAPINHPPAQFGARPHLAYCPACRAQLLTRVEYQATMMTHIIAAILCCTTCSCCIPYLFDNCKSARHYCPQCDNYLGAQVK
ncbi:lipopolysaccharide-induced tumor necrosis factor-alpha factor homolog [Musca autumnalis]|uniref:lipopolysaccharide-induced tumor necrosis factor-alpha factor homolog n=1 Tax=Musca autumnalis TaxID=221902 RepID=UPI003CEB0B11